MVMHMWLSTFPWHHFSMTLRCHPRCSSSALFLCLSADNVLVEDNPGIMHRADMCMGSISSGP